MRTRRNQEVAMIRRLLTPVLLAAAFVVSTAPLAHADCPPYIIFHPPFC
jgi:hypothetical protein